MQVLLTLMARDTHETLHRTQSLQGVLEQALMVDSLLQSNFPRWRSLSSNLLDILENLRHNLQDLTKTNKRSQLMDLELYSKSWTSLIPESQKTYKVPLIHTNLAALREDSHDSALSLVNPLLSSVDTTIQRIQRVSGSLQSTLALLESKRGIAEAESVTKLTELAFLFIPISFTASFFSMPVNVRAPLSAAIDRRAFNN